MHVCVVVGVCENTPKKHVCFDKMQTGASPWECTVLRAKLLDTICNLSPTLHLSLSLCVWVGVYVCVCVGICPFIVTGEEV